MQLNNPRHARARFFQSHPQVRITAVVAALAGFLFGYDSGSISAAILYIRSDFGISTMTEQVIVASMLLGAVGGASAGGALADRFGRKRLVMVTAGLAAAASIACGIAGTVAVLVAARLVLGLCIGAGVLIVAAYVAEIAPPASRGRLVSLTQLMSVTGVVVSLLVGYALAEATAWRWLLGLGAVPAVVMLFGLVRLDESPRWLFIKGQPQQARRVLARTRRPDEAEAEITEITNTAEAERASSYRDLLKPALRPALLLGIAIAATNQLVGVNAVLYYAPTMLQQAGFGASAAILSAVGINTVNAVLTLVAIMLIDRVGRRRLVFISLTGVVIALIVLGFLRLVPTTPLVGALLVGFLMIYMGFFAVGIGVAIWIVNSEIFPTALRAKGGSVGNTLHWILNFVISLTALTLIQTLTPSGLFWLFAAFGVCGGLFLYRKMPETKGRSLEDIQTDLRAGHRA